MGLGSLICCIGVVCKGFVFLGAVVVVYWWGRLGETLLVSIVCVVGVGVDVDVGGGVGVVGVVLVEEHNFELSYFRMKVGHGVQHKFDQIREVLTVGAEVGDMVLDSFGHDAVHHSFLTSLATLMADSMVDSFFGGGALGCIWTVVDLLLVGEGVGVVEFRDF